MTDICIKSVYTISKSVCYKLCFKEEKTKRNKFTDAERSALNIYSFELTFGLFCDHLYIFTHLHPFYLKHPVYMLIQKVAKKSY